MTVSRPPVTGAVAEISKTVTFEAAHRIAGPGQPSEYGRLHGHSFELTAVLKGVADPDTGWVADLGALGMAMEELVAELDHGYLNDIEGLERPTLEALCAWAAGRLKPTFPELARVEAARPSLRERCRLELTQED